MKILLAYLGRRGGGNIYAYEIARAVAEKIEIICLLSSQVENKEAWAESGLKCYYIPTYTSVVTAGLSLTNIKNRNTIKRIIKEESPDLIYYPMGHLWTPFINMDIARWLPKVITVHDPHPHLGEYNVMLQILSTWGKRQANRIVVLHNGAVRELEDQGFSKENIDVIPHGAFSYYKDRNSTHIKYNSGDRVNILFFGRILPYKGLEILLQAFPLIKAKIPNARLMIAGEGDIQPYKPLMADIEDIVVYNRWIADEEVADFFEQADLVVIPYIDASQSGVIPIAYSMGKPVVASKIAGLTEQVIDYQSGLFVQPGDSIDLSNKCIEILTNDELRLLLIDGGYELANTLMNWNTIGDQLVKCFEMALKGFRVQSW